MKIKKWHIFAGLAIAIAAVFTFFPAIDVNVIFDRCLNTDEVATVFSGTSFHAREYYMVNVGFAQHSRTTNSELFGTLLEGAALEAALAETERATGYIVLDGSISLIDMIKIKSGPFVDDVTIYFPILDWGDREILPGSSSGFFEKHPEARYWE